MLIDYRGKSPQKSPTGIPVISAKVVKDGLISDQVEQTIAPDSYGEWMRRGLPRVGDVVMTTEAPLGEVAQLDEKTARYALGQRIVTLRGKAGEVSNEFLKYALMSPLMQQRLAARATGTTVFGISQKALRTVPLRLPNLATQVAVAGLLKILDDKIELNRRMNKTLEAMAQAIFRDWFVDFGPTRRKMEGASAPVAIVGSLTLNSEKAAALAPLFPVAFADNGLPEGWEERPFVSFIDIVGGGTPETKVAEYWDGDIPWFSVVDTPPKGAVFVRSTERSITEEGLLESSARLVPAGATIITARGTVGNIAIAAREMTFNQSCYALRAQAPVGDRFVYLATERMVQRLQAMAHGSVFSTITRTTFEGLSFPWVGERLFKEFETLLEPVLAKIDANGMESAILAEARDLLLPRLMSGEVRLRSAEARI